MIFQKKSASPTPAHPGTFSLSLEKGLFIDIEAVPGGEIFGMGAVMGTTFRREAGGVQNVARLVAELRGLAASAHFIGGHNIIAHDLPRLAAAHDISELQKLPALDTLYLSPLAFPRNPYHKLVKNDRLVNSAKNHPARDCESSMRIFQDAAKAFAAGAADAGFRERVALARFLLSRADIAWNGSTGMDLFFGALGIPELAPAQAAAIWQKQTSGFACPDAVRKEWELAQTDPRRRGALAYVLMWLPFAGADSVLPGWVRKQFPLTGEVIRSMRNTSCGTPRCPWCGTVQNPTGQLARFFNYPSFRPEPSLPGHPGKSLQEEIVRQAMNGVSLLAILPTGGGKSLCFQVPALHRHFTTGALTIVVTPLQALMKDQVDGLINKASVSCVAALYGMQTPPEKAEVREAVRLGSIGILYVSPEQLRNSSFRNTILQREIGLWVFDEAHCLSQWGHDFRPDYVYVSRFIREIAGDQLMPVPPVLCVTATAKDDVRNEIIRHFEQELGQQLLLLDGGAERTNLEYRVEMVNEIEKNERIHALLSEKIPNGIGAAVVFAATRKRVEAIAAALASAAYGWSCEAFHAGLGAEKKKEILDDYLGGRTQVVVATNAFGMGIDKPDIRLVIHADTPGSLENYIQEAGRAGRDQEPAECVLLYNPEDIETQFGLHSMSKIEKRDIDNIWRAISKADRNDGQPLCVTAGELLYDPENPVSFDGEPDDRRETKVRTAISVLEKQGFLERDENRTRVFQARPLVPDEAAARARIAQLDLPENKRILWTDVMLLLLAQEEEGGRLDMNQFAELPGMKMLYEQAKARTRSHVSPYAPVFAVLNEMAQPQTGLIRKDMFFSALLRVGRVRNAGHQFRKITSREHDFIEMLRDAEPNPEGWAPLSIRHANQSLVSKGHENSLTDDVLRMLVTLSTDGRKMGRPAALLDMRRAAHGHVELRLAATWMAIRELALTRNAAASVLLDLIMKKARGAQSGESTLALAEFSESEIIEAFKSDMTLNPQAVRDLPAFIQYLLVYLHENDVIELKNGKALISQSMSLKILETRAPGKQRRRFTKGDYSSLLVHYSAKIFQIHVMGEYARAGIERLSWHLRLIAAYFSLGRVEFARQFLRHDAEVYERATGMESYEKIVGALRNPVQQAIVAEPPDTNMLVLAGPGSGKTRVVAHRCAWLLRVQRIRGERILVVCFNRHAALQLRRRIHQLVGRDAHGVTIQTYHGLALRLLGRSLVDMGAEAGADTPPDFGKLLEDATAALTGSRETDGVRGDDVRDRMLARFSHILVDEYQDVDEREYAFISAIAGRREPDEDKKLSIMAVGDDDQSIYGFKGANVEFIRRFREDYRAREHYLVENYRSSAAIIDAANRLIAQNTDRMKVSQDIRINRLRRDAPPGGRWQALDPVVQGRVQRIHVRDALQQARFITGEIKRLHGIDPSQKYSAFAVLARTWEELYPVRSMLDDAGIPADWREDAGAGVSQFQIREIHEWLEYLKGAQDELWTPREVRSQLITLRRGKPSNRWWRLLDTIRDEWGGEAGDASVRVSTVRDFFADAIAEKQRNRQTGDGVVLSTMHKTKGLEFPHVFIADGRRRATADKAETEEERRIFYVAMTRAMETLGILSRKDIRASFAGSLAAGKWLIDRTPPASISGAPVAPFRQPMHRYAVIGPDGIFLSHAAGKPAHDPVHKALRGISTGDQVRLMASGDDIHIKSESGVTIGALSKSGCASWKERLPVITTVTVIAMVRRTKAQQKEEYRGKVLVDAWEYPLLEVRWDELPAGK